MATMSENAEIAVLQSQVQTISSQVKELDAKIDHVLTRLELFATLHNEIENLKNDIAAVKKRNLFIGWLYPTASAGFSAVLTYLILSRLNK